MLMRKWTRARLMLIGALEISIYTLIIVLATIGAYPFFFTR